MVVFGVKQMSAGGAMSYVSGDQAITNDLQIYMANGRPLPRIWVSLVVRIRREFITSSSTLLYAHVTVYAHCMRAAFSFILCC